MVTIGDVIYLAAQGRYADWDDFDALVHGVFTDAYWDERNDSGNGVLLHVESEGRHCFLDTGIGLGYYYNKDVPDAFRLEKKTESEIAFTLIGHYNFFGDEEGVTEEQRREGEARGYDYTLEFPIRLVLTENGWRFDEFHSSLVDEESPQYQYADNDDGTITITKYRGFGGDVIVPAQINGKQVTAIGNTFGETGAFQDCGRLTSVVIPEGVTEIQDNAFQGCTGLTSAVIPASVRLLRNCAFDGCGSLRAVYFEGDAPRAANYVFSAEAALTIYYHEGTTGWTDPWYGRPTESY